LIIQKFSDGKKYEKKTKEKSSAIPYDEKNLQKRKERE
jgi:hypothetical protein